MEHNIVFIFFHLLLDIFKPIQLTKHYIFLSIKVFFGLRIILLLTPKPQNPKTPLSE